MRQYSSTLCFIEFKVGLCISNHVRIKIGHIQLVIALSQSNCMCVSHRILDNCAIEKLKVETLHDILHAQTLVLRSINTVERCDYIFMLSNSNDIENISEAQNLYGGINKMWMWKRHPNKVEIKNKCRRTNSQIWTFRWLFDRKQSTDCEHDSGLGSLDFLQWLHSTRNGFLVMATKNRMGNGKYFGICWALQ